MVIKNIHLYVPITYIHEASANSKLVIYECIRIKIYIFGANYYTELPHFSKLIFWKPEKLDSSKKDLYGIEN